jgi:hypothetical protein
MQLILVFKKPFIDSNPMGRRDGCPGPSVWRDARRDARIRTHNFTRHACHGGINVDWRGGLAAD